MLRIFNHNFFVAVANDSVWFQLENLYQQLVQIELIKANQKCFLLLLIPLRDNGTFPDCKK